MAQINKPTDYFETKLYAGSSSNVTVSGLDFQPDWIWLKNRTNADNHVVCDVVRGGNSNGLGNLYPNLTDAEYLPSSTNDSIETINSDGFVVGGNGNTNGSGENFVSWSWKAGGTGVSNTDGSITSTVSANTTSGFSIVSYTGSGSVTSFGHGLGVAPSMVIIKNRDNTDEWTVFHKGISSGQGYIVLNSTAAAVTGSSRRFRYGDDSDGKIPDSSKVYLGTASGVNTSGEDYIAYCFADKKGFSKFGSYTGNGSTDGTFIYTGFKPAFVIMKRTDTTGHWLLFDNNRSSSGGSNLIQEYLYPNLADAESSDATRGIDFLSNGFKQRNNFSAINASGGSYIYMAFAKSPFTTSTGIPTTAR